MAEDMDMQMEGEKVSVDGDQVLILSFFENISRIRST